MKGRVFYSTRHFHPRYERKLFSLIEGDRFRLNASGELYRRRELYNWGYGNEKGFVKLPEPGFEELIVLIRDFRERKRLFGSDRERLEVLVGAVAVVMSDFRNELVDWLEANIDGSLFEDPAVVDNFKWFCFVSGLEKPPFYGGVGVHSYEWLMNQVPKWHEIRDEVLDKLYGFKYEPVEDLRVGDEEDEDDQPL